MIGKLNIVEEFKNEKDEKNPLTILLKLVDTIERHPQVSPSLNRDLIEPLEEAIELMVGPTLAEELIGGNR